LIIKVLSFARLLLVKIDKITKKYRIILIFII